MLCLVLRQVLGQPGDLVGDHGADAEDHHEGEQDGGEHRGRSPEMQAPQQENHGPERKAQQQGESQGHENVAREVERGDDDAADRQ